MIDFSRVAGFQWDDGNARKILIRTMSLRMKQSRFSRISRC